MTTANVNLLGQANNTGVDDALFLEKFSGRVLLTFERSTVARQRSTIESEQWGKAITINAVGDAETTSHTRGEEILGQMIPQGERTIVPEDLIISSTFVADYDKLLAHFQTSDKFATKMGQAMANRYDRDILRVGIMAADATPAGKNLAGIEGTVIDNPAGAPALVAADLIAAGMQAAQLLDEKDVPDNDNRTLYLAPAQYWLLVSAGNDLIDRDFGGTGSVARGLVTRLGNLEVVKSNNFAAIQGQAQQTEGLAADGVTPAVSVYDVDTSSGSGGLDVTALVMTPEAVISGEWLGVTSESAYDIRRQGTLLLSKIVKGTAIMRPECSVVIGGASNTVPAP